MSAPRCPQCHGPLSRHEAAIVTTPRTIPTLLRDTGAPPWTVVDVPHHATFLACSRCEWCSEVADLIPSTRQR